MKRLISIALLAVAIAAGGCGSSNKHNDNKKIQTISIHRAPSAVVNTAYREYPGAKITRIERDNTTPQTHYIVYLRTPDGMNREIVYDVNGTNLSR